MRGGTKIQGGTSPQPPLLVRSSWKHNDHWIRQRTIETHIKYCDHQCISTCCVRRCTFQAISSALQPLRKVSSLASGSHALHGWQAGPLTGISMMKLLAGLDDARVTIFPLLATSPDHKAAMPVSSHPSPQIASIWKVIGCSVHHSCQTHHAALGERERCANRATSQPQRAPDAVSLCMTDTTCNGAVSAAFLFSNRRKA